MSTFLQPGGRVQTVREGEKNLRKNVDKKEKELKMKVKDLETKLAESYSVVETKVQENVKLAEVNKTLEKVIEIVKLENKALTEDTTTEEDLPDVEIVFLDNNEDPFDNEVINFYIMQCFESANEENETEESINKEKKEEDVDIADILVVEDDEDPNDDEVIAFYLQQSLNRAKRTSPTSEATMNNENKGNSVHCKSCSFKAGSKALLNKHEQTKHKVKCMKCNFSAETKVQMNCHNMAQHLQNVQSNKKSTTTSPPENRTSFACNKCNFTARSSAQLRKHMNVRHSEICWYWQNGFCSRDQCRFEHERKEHLASEKGYRNSNPTCRYQQFCKSQNCKFEQNFASNEKRTCRYGSFCENSACQFDHRNTFLGQRMESRQW